MILRVLLMSGLFFVSGFSPVARPAILEDPPCKGTRANRTAVGQPWTLTCAGDCPAAKTCKSRSITCNGVQITACACNGGTVCPDTNCCSVVLNDSGVPITYGDCPSCPTTGPCVLCPDNPTTPLQYQPVCGSC